jgi:hypothetical protein
MNIFLFSIRGHFTVCLSARFAVHLKKKTSQHCTSLVTSECQDGRVKHGVFPTDDCVESALALLQLRKQIR